jgi:transcriptional regulator with XRE-family HTH domain
MRTRIEQFIESEKLTAAEFADIIGVQRSSVSHVLKGRNNPGFSFIQKILESYPAINSRWLLTGNGPMYDNKSITSKEQARPSIHEPDLFSTSNNTTEPIPGNAKQKTDETPATSNRTAPDEKEVSTKQTVTAETISKKIVKVLIFYDDHTFEDFRPAE